MGRLRLLRILIGAVVYVHCLVTGCASNKENTPQSIVATYAHQASDDTPETTYLKRTSQKPVVETIEVGQEIAMRVNDNWTFSPSFILETTPDAALTTLEEAILRNDAAAFCNGITNFDACQRIFREHTRFFSDAYQAETGSRIWHQTSLGLSTTLARITFFFERQADSWQLTAFCAVNTDDMSTFPKCKL